MMTGLIVAHAYSSALEPIRAPHNTLSAAHSTIRPNRRGAESSLTLPRIQSNTLRVNLSRNNAHVLGA